MLLRLLLLFGTAAFSKAETPQYGLISSPDYPKTYPDNQHITWNITAKKGFHISLKFLVFELEPSDGCNYDYVKIFSPAQKIVYGRIRMVAPRSQDVFQVIDDNREMGRFCGPKMSRSHPGHRLFTSHGNQMKLVFHSGVSNKANGLAIFSTGFQAFYQAVDDNECASPSDKSLTWTPPCQHICHNYIGGYFCTCFLGYKLQSDNRSCEVVSCEEPEVLRNGGHMFLTEPNKVTYKSKIVYSCNAPYYKMVTRTGSDIFTCTENCLWTDENGGSEIPRCLPVCGQPENPVIHFSRVINGKKAENGNFPWQVFIRSYGRGAGVLIDETWVLTAANVLKPEGSTEDLDVNKLQVFLGDVDINNLLKNGPAKVKAYYIHPDYSTETHDDDIALIQLENPVTMNHNVAPICLPESGDETLYESDRIGYVSGFGLTEEHRLASRLRYVFLPMVADDKCRQQLIRKKLKKLKFTKNMFCAGYPEDEKLSMDSCAGDSGGAFAIKGEEKWVATGLVSWGFDCGRGYGYYTKVVNYIDWIKSHIDR